MKFKELKNKSTNELNKILGELRNSLRDMKFKVSSNQLKNIREIRVAKKTIARVLLLLTEKKENENKLEKKQDNLDKLKQPEDNKK